MIPILADWYEMKPRFYYFIISNCSQTCVHGDVLIFFSVIDYDDVIFVLKSAKELILLHRLLFFFMNNQQNSNIK